MVKNVVIFGSGAHAHVISDIILKIKEYKLIGLIDSSSVEKMRYGFPVFKDLNEAKKSKSKDIFTGIIGVGDNALRFEIANEIKLKHPRFDFINAIHPNAVISSNVSLGKGIAIMAGVVVNTGSKIDDHCIINTSSLVDHDCKLHDFSSLAPGTSLGGNVELGKFSSIGIGANIFHKVKIGENTIIGGGSLVNKDVGDNICGYGVPFKQAKKHIFGEKYL